MVEYYKYFDMWGEHKKNLFYDSIHRKFKKKQKQSKVFKVTIGVTLEGGEWVVSGGNMALWVLIWSGCHLHGCAQFVEIQWVVYLFVHFSV